MKVKEVSFKAYESGSLHGFAKVTLEDSDGDSLVIDSVRFMSKEGDNGKYYFAAMPSDKFKNKDGNDAYKNIVTLEKDLRKKVNEAVYAEYKKSETPTTKKQSPEEETLDAGLPFWGEIWQNRNILKRKLLIKQKWMLLRRSKTNVLKSEMSNG